MLTRAASLRPDARRPATTRAARATLAASAALALGCSASPVAWGDVTYPATVPVTPAPAVAVVPPDACPGSFRAAAIADTLYAAWWRVRPDSSALLMAGRSVDGGRDWVPVAAADTTDRSRRGCRRPPPTVFAQGNGYVSFAYFLEAAGGPGVFYTHSMDAAHLGTGNGVFHSPVAVSYGERPARVALSADGDRVAVAYEDPNAERPRVSLALSRTMGHIFEARVAASPGDIPAAHPGVQLRGDRVTVWWMERPDTATAGRIALRSGRWR